MISLYSPEEQARAKSLLLDAHIEDGEFTPQNDNEKMLLLFWKTMQDNPSAIFEGMHSLVSYLHKESKFVVFQSTLNGFCMGYCEAEVEQYSSSDMPNDHLGIKYEAPIDEITLAKYGAAINIDISNVQNGYDLYNGLVNKYDQQCKDAGLSDGANPIIQKIQSLFENEESSNDSLMNHIQSILRFANADSIELKNILIPCFASEEECNLFIDNFHVSIMNDFEYAAAFHLSQILTSYFAKNDIRKIHYYIRISKSFILERLEQYERWKHICYPNLVFSYLGSYSYSKDYSAELLSFVYLIYHQSECRLLYLIIVIFLYDNGIDIKLRIYLMDLIINNNYYDLPEKIQNRYEDLDSMANFIKVEPELWSYIGLTKNGKFQSTCDIDGLKNSTVGPLDMDKVHYGGPLAIKILVNYLGDSGYLVNSPENLENFAYYVFGIGKLNKSKDTKIKIGEHPKSKNNLVSIIKNLITKGDDGDKYKKFFDQTDLGISYQASDAYNQSKDIEDLLKLLFDTDSDAKEENTQDILSDIQNNLRIISSSIKQINKQIKTKMSEQETTK